MFQTKSSNYVATILCQLLPKSSAQLPPSMKICASAPGAITCPCGLAAGTQHKALLRPRAYRVAYRVTLRCRPLAHGRPLALVCYVVFMRLVINAEERNLGASTLDALIEELGMKGDRVAVELNREIVPRASWSATILKDGDRLEIVHFVGGGSPGPGPGR
jgi:sulfur carrier protein